MTKLDGYEKGSISLSELKALLLNFSEECKNYGSVDLDMIEEFIQDYNLIDKSWVYDDEEEQDDDPSYGFD